MNTDKVLHHLDVAAVWYEFCAEELGAARKLGYEDVRMAMIARHSLEILELLRGMRNDVYDKDHRARRYGGGRGNDQRREGEGA